VLRHLFQSLTLRFHHFLAPFWMSPELLRGDCQNNATTDIYSVGIIFYEVFSRKEPYEGEDSESVLKQVMDPTINKVR